MLVIYGQSGQIAVFHVFCLSHENNLVPGTIIQNRYLRGELKYKS